MRRILCLDVVQQPMKASFIRVQRHFHGTRKGGFGGMSEGFRQRLGKATSKVSMPDQGAVEIHRSVKAFSPMRAHGVVTVGSLMVRREGKIHRSTLRRP